ncbi:MAG: purine-nucleoside phosphorylase [Thermobacillus sp. ZCTH02-B1]|uniref:nucleoside phosphorylase n=1 Tax=Thermobacillus sp. ZCTH02-B1 TaxID=1858795 RepID=UPI000B5782EB|nr:nucleoside phosphorylase [Thermobacillus sp. ZCTH02-B1]OUM94385.1 MAG: purine-nucleoside phosphorylase [Thermobacillus sp. ZCTH02-B1]
MKLPVLRVDPDDIPAYAIVCGDPFRAENIAGRLEDARELAFAREYRTFVGRYDGVELAVASHGVGSPGAAVCFEELARAGVRTIIRVGTAGSLSPAYPAGSLIVSTAAVREDGLTKQLVPPGFPAVADSAVTEALYREAAALGGRVGKGITATFDAFYTGVVELPHAVYAKAGVLAVEMEIAALYVIAALRGMRAGAIVALDGDADTVDEAYNPHRDIVAEAVERGIGAALRAVASLARADASGAG